MELIGLEINQVILEYDMKIKIGPYINWIGPYQIAEILCFWAKDVPDEFGIKRKPDWVHDFGTWLAEDQDGESSMLAKLCSWVHEKRNRTVKVKIDPWDTWSMDATLAMIILPMLKQLNEKKHGAPFVDDADVPEHIRSTAAPPKENEHDTDEFHFQRWDWVMAEMIWTFEQLQPDYDWESQYYSGEADFKFVPCKDNSKFSEMVEGPKHTFKLDKQGHEKHNARIDNGLKLFGKYYRGLWD